MGVGHSKDPLEVVQPCDVQAATEPAFRAGDLTVLRAVSTVLTGASGWWGGREGAPVLFRRQHPFWY